MKERSGHGEGPAGESGEQLGELGLDNLLEISNLTCYYHHFNFDSSWSCQRVNVIQYQGIILEWPLARGNEHLHLLDL